MTRTLLTIAAATAALSALPAGARQYSSVIKCSGWRGSECVAWNRLTKEQAAQIKTGFVFPKNYTYTQFSTIPQTVVTQYSLDPKADYVTADGYIWVVDPNTYAVTKVITVPSP